MNWHAPQCSDETYDETQDPAADETIDFIDFKVTYVETQDILFQRT